MLPAATFTLADAPSPSASGAIPVEIIEADGQYLLRRGGEPYYVRGVGGHERLAELAAIGGNSIRTWGDPTRELLDEAYRHGLSVAVGLWIEHERHGFDYGDPEAVAAQRARHFAAIDAFKDHPAVLLWGIGNEVELGATDPRVWDTVEAVAAYARKVDPHHPTMTVTAHLDPEVVAEIKHRAPSVQILGINAYAGIHAIPAAVAEHWQGPYLVTEWGTDGTWEVDDTAWGAEIEPTSTEKAFLRALRHAVFGADTRYCLGGYAFLWGHKQETTGTWFNLFQPDGARKEGVEVLAAIWGGTVPTPAAPRISPLTLNGQKAGDSLTVAPGSALAGKFHLLAGRDDLGDVVWKVRRESDDKRMGGDAEAIPPVVATTFIAPTAEEVFLAAPEAPGAYRLYLYAYTEDRVAVATANFPFRVAE